MLLRTELTTALPCGSCLPPVFFAEPWIAIGLDVVGGGIRVDVPVEAAKPLVQLISRDNVARMRSPVIHSTTRTIQVGAR